MRNTVVISTAVVAALAWSSHARADNISTVIGQPTSSDWNALCSAPTEPFLDDPALECDPLLLPDCMLRVAIDPTTFPNAVCNDGTPGAFYIRPSTTGDTRWVIHLMGGGGCMDGDDCFARWCGENGYTADVMSTDWNLDGDPDIPDAILMGGMRYPGGANAFADFNHVYVFYCSSDGWVGEQSAVPFTTGTGLTYEMDVRGHTILHVVRRMLRKMGPTAGWTAYDGITTLPDLDDATEILFTGTSAGGYGAVMNADWFLSVFPNAAVGLVVDAAMEPTDASLVAYDIWIDSDDDGSPDTDAVTFRVDQRNDQWGAGGYFDLVNGFADETCVANETIDRCTITSELLLTGEVTTPTAVRMELHDPVVSQPWFDDPLVFDESGFVGSAPGTDMNMDDYGRLLRRTLTDLYVAATPVTGAYGPRCDSHVGLELTIPMGLDLTPDVVFTFPFGLASLGNDLTLEDFLVQWWNAGAPVARRRIDFGGATGASACWP